jgi:tRNA threonylcarbamoyladenosine biosynthesis protein TsaE
MKTISVAELSGLPDAARQILSFAGTKRILCFYGDLGAGKTTLIKELCKQLGVTDAGSSPTFSLVNEYASENGEKLFHFDLYRLKNEQEIYDIGYEEYLFSGNYCFIEWPEKMEKLLPK